MPSMGVDAFFPVPDAESFAAVARKWLGELPGLLAPEAWEEVLRAGKPPFRGTPDTRWPEYDEWEEPFMAWGAIAVAPLKWNGMRIWYRRVRRSNLEWLAEVLADRPVSARISIGRVDAKGIMLPGGVEVSAQSGLGKPGELIPAGRLSARDSLMWRPGARLEDTAGLRERLAGVAREWAARPGMRGVFAGEILEAEMELPFSGPPGVIWANEALDRELLGYSWLTMCPPGPAGRLGGAGTLRASGAFWQVDELADGAVLLQATERAEEYDLTAAERVYEVLASVLPPAQRTGEG